MQIDKITVQCPLFSAFERRNIFKLSEFRENKLSVLHIQHWLKFKLNAVFICNGFQIIQQAFSRCCQFNADIFACKSFSVIFAVTNFIPAKIVASVNCPV